jgi:acetyl-CoA carboxylase carboxyl transferase subunit alpha
MRVTPNDLLELSIIDRILKEPAGGAHNDHAGAAAVVKTALLEELTALAELTPDELIRQRIDKFSKMGVWTE